MNKPPAKHQKAQKKGPDAEAALHIASSHGPSHRDHETNQESQTPAQKEDKGVYSFRES